MALPAYRNLLRATRVAFHGDLAVMGAARAEARNNFEIKRNLEPSSEETQKSIAHANEVAKFLKENVVQGQAVDEGRYKLRIHEHTERGDNESIKQNKGNNTLSGVKCCSA